jgi:ribosomal protein S14
MPAKPLQLSAHDPKVKEIILEGISILQSHSKPNVAKVAQELTATHGIVCPYSTLYRRFNGNTVAASDAHIHQQLLTPGAETVLVDWLIFLGETSHGINKLGLCARVKQTCRKKPSDTWVDNFLRRHPEVVLRKTSGLDPKWAQAFNRNVVDDYFTKLTNLVKKHNIPWEQVYNMDEKGCQRGGSRRSSLRKFFVSRTKRTKYRPKSANLELVTVIECICADGTELSPGFVFSGKEFSPEWFEVDPNIR